MARFDWSKATRLEAGRQAHAMGIGDFRTPARPAKRATEKQKNYIKILLAKTGRRQFTPRELSGMSIDGATRLIKELRGE